MTPATESNIKKCILNILNHVLLLKNQKGAITSLLKSSSTAFMSFFHATCSEKDTKNICSTKNINM